MKTIIILGSLLALFILVAVTPAPAPKTATAAATLAPAAPTPTPEAQPKTAAEIATRSAKELGRMARAMSRGEEYTSQFVEPPYPPISEWSQPEINTAVIRAPGENSEENTIIAILQGEFDRQLAKKHLKRAYLWALNYIEAIEKRTIQHGRDSLNINPTSLQRDIRKGADHYYPEDRTMNRWFQRFAYNEIVSLGKETVSTFKEHTLPEEAMAQIRADRAEWREELNTSPDYNEVRKAIAVTK